MKQKKNPLCVCMCLFVCVCVYVCTCSNTCCAGIHKCMHIHVETKNSVDCHAQVPSTMTLRQNLSLAKEAGQLTGQPKGSSCLIPALELQAYFTMLAFSSKHGFQGLNSGPCPNKTITFQTKTCTQPKYLLS